MAACVSRSALVYLLVIVLVPEVLCQDTGYGLGGIQHIFSFIHSWANPTTAATPSLYQSYDNEWGTGLCSQECSCGIPKQNTRIIGGEATQVNEFPWVVALTKGGNIYCGGTLISDRHVLTAAHCLDQNYLMVRMTTSVVLAGHYTSHVVGIPSYHVEKRNVGSIMRHPNFRPKRGTMDNDIAIITLATPVKFRAELSPVCLPSPGEDFANQGGIVSGWGRLKEKGASASQLRAVYVPILAQDECLAKSVYGASHITDNMMCAGKISGGVDSCQGDSGGALVVTDRYNRSVAAGIVSWGEGCGRPYRPGVYTRVNRYLEWIQRHTRDGCFCG